MKNFTLSNVSVIEGKELLAGLAARRRELDKAFKACMKADAQAASEKVHERMKSVDDMDNRIKEAIADAE